MTDVKSQLDNHVQAHLPSDSPGDEGLPHEVESLTTQMSELHTQLNDIESRLGTLESEEGSSLGGEEAGDLQPNHTPSPYAVTVLTAELGRTRHNISIINTTLDRVKRDVNRKKKERAANRSPNPSRGSPSPHPDPQREGEGSEEAEPKREEDDLDKLGLLQRIHDYLKGLSLEECLSCSTFYIGVAVSICLIVTQSAFLIGLWCYAMRL